MVVVLPWHDPIRVAEGIASARRHAGRAPAHDRLRPRASAGASSAGCASRWRSRASASSSRSTSCARRSRTSGSRTRAPSTRSRAPRCARSPARRASLEQMYCAWGSPQTIPIAAPPGSSRCSSRRRRGRSTPKQMERFNALRSEPRLRAGAPDDRVLGLLRRDRGEGLGGRAQVHPGLRRQRHAPLRARERPLPRRRAATSTTPRAAAR